LFRRAIFIALVCTGCVMLIAFVAAAAPTEEDLPASPPLHHAPARTTPPAALAPKSSAPEVNAPAAPAAPEAVPPAASAPDTTPGAAAPRSYFPYTVRLGDSLEGIAALFGVQSTDIARANRHLSDQNLIAGDTIRIPNPSVTRERELTSQVERLSIDQQEAEQKTAQALNTVASLRSELDTANSANARDQHDLRMLPWWRGAAWMAAVAAVLMLGISLLAVIEWLMLRWRYGALAELNNSLRRLDQKYRMLLAKAELRLQELYGRRRRGVEEGQERPPLPEEFELERLDRELKQILENHLDRLGPPGRRARRARSRELIGTVGAPIEARATRR
jgi:LysM repeat protein